MTPTTIPEGRHRICRICGEELPINEFYRRPFHRKYRKACKRCEYAGRKLLRDSLQAQVHDRILSTLTIYGAMSAKELGEALGRTAQSIGNTIHPLRRAGRLECHQNPEHRRIRLWCLPGRLERTPPIMAPQVAPKSLPLPTTIPQELNKLKATPAAQGPGIDDDDLLWMAHYRAQAAARQDRGQHQPS